LINLTVLKSLPVPIPPLSEQRAIASVLSSLDDKIDLLHRQNKTLEAMAETLFRQWFVEEVDEEWEEKPLSFYGTIICGKTPSKKVQSYFNGDIPFIKIPDMHGNVFLFDTIDSLTEEGKRSQTNKTLPPKSICVSCIATVGLVSLNAKESQTNQQINSIIPNEDYYRYYLYLTMRSLYDLLHSMASGGTATLNLNTGDFSQISVLYPEESVLEAFHSEIELLFDKIFFNQSQIRTLEKLRDTLLPKLMSGEVRVEYEDVG
jgi:type I restriction enzyme S subunit